MEEDTLEDMEEPVEVWWASPIQRSSPLTQRELAVDRKFRSLTRTPRRMECPQWTAAADPTEIDE